MNAAANPARVDAIRWDPDGRLLLLDQRRLPREETYLALTEPADVARAIADLVVRGAPAIGITAAYGVVLAARKHAGEAEAIEREMEILAAARPTAVNLRWALERMRGVVRANAGGPDTERALLDEAAEIHREDLAANLAMGGQGAALIEPGSSVLTHCNAGALATGGYGTALGVVRAAFERGLLGQVYAGETRPWLQGARLTAWELARDGIPVTLVAEGAVATLMREHKVQWLVVGADRIVANGDTANKIGTYSAALHARTHGARTMVVAPTSTVDLSIATGVDIPIETRAEQELLELGGTAIAPAGVGAWNPVFDVTPAELIDAIVTEKGVARPPYTESLAAMLAG